MMTRINRSRRMKKKNDSCAVEAALDVIGNKWKGAILYHLLDGTKRFNEICRLIPSVTQRVLTLNESHINQDALITKILQTAAQTPYFYISQFFGKIPGSLRGR